MYGLAICFLHSESDRNFARKRPEGEKPSSISDFSPDVVTLRTQNSSDDRRFGHNVASRFKKWKTFSTKKGEDINEFTANYIEGAADSKLSVSQKLCYFHNIFEGDAKDSTEPMYNLHTILSKKGVLNCKMNTEV